MNILDAQTLNQKPGTVFEKHKCAAKLNVAFSFVLKNLEEGVCRFYYAHEKKNILMARSRLLATKENLLKIKVVLINTVVIKACTKKRANTKWKFYKLTNVTVFAALLREVPMGCIDAVLLEPLAEIHRV